MTILTACQVLVDKGLLQELPASAAAGDDAPEVEGNLIWSVSQSVFTKKPLAAHSSAASAYRTVLGVSVTAFPA